MPVILATSEPGIKIITVYILPEQKVHKTPSQPIVGMVAHDSHCNDNWHHKNRRIMVQANVGRKKDHIYFLNNHIKMV
jgi:hypothetical protein